MSASDPKRNFNSLKNKHKYDGCENGYKKHT